MKEVNDYPKLETISTLLVGKLITQSKNVLIRFFTEEVLTGMHTSIRIMGDKKLLGIIGLILRSSTFINTLYKTLPSEYTGYGFRTKILKTMPIPIETTTNKVQFDRLREIGQILIVLVRKTEFTSGYFQVIHV